MPTTGAIIAGTGASLTGIGTVAWTNSGNITASDNTHANNPVNSGAVSNWLVATNFNFSTIPDDAVILGMTGTTEAKYAINVGSITAARLVVGNAVVGTQLAPALSLTTSDANYTIDLSPGTVGYPITPALLKVSTTGFAISVTGGGGNPCTITVDAMWLTVTYMVAGRTLRTRRVRRTNRH